MKSWPRKVRSDFYFSYSNKRECGLSAEAVGSIKEKKKDSKVYKTDLRILKAAGEAIKNEKIDKEKARFASRHNEISMMEEDKDYH